MWEKWLPLESKYGRRTVWAEMRNWLIEGQEREDLFGRRASGQLRERDLGCIKPEQVAGAETILEEAIEGSRSLSLALATTVSQIFVRRLELPNAIHHFQMVETSERDGCR